MEEKIWTAKDEELLFVQGIVEEARVKHKGYNWLIGQIIGRRMDLLHEICESKEKEIKQCECV